MFKSQPRALQISMVRKNQQTEGPPLESTKRTNAEITAIFQDQVEFLFGLVARAYIGKKIVDTAAEVIKKSL